MHPTQYDVKLSELVQYGARQVAMNLQVTYPHWNFLDSTNNIPLHTETVCVVSGGRQHSCGCPAGIYFFSSKDEALSLKPRVMACVYLCFNVHVHSVEQKSIGLKFSKSQTGSDVGDSCHHNSSRLLSPYLRIRGVSLSSIHYNQSHRVYIN